MSTIAFIILFIIIASFTWGALLAAPWVPTLKAQRDLLIEHLDLSSLDPRLRRDDTIGAATPYALRPTPSLTIYDLGCGSGSILFAFADRYPEARCIGYDVAIIPLAIGLFRKLRNPKRYRNVSLRFGNFFTKHFPDADLVVAFLMQGVYEKFITKLSSELKPGTLIALEAWPLPDREPTQTITGKELVPWYVYKMK
jgi:SAM-dependent methyltransferase